MSFSQAAALFSVMFVLSATPGPSDFAVVARSLTAGFRQGMMMTLGIVAGDFLFIAFAIYSLSEVAESMSGLFSSVRYICAAYLVWLGANTLKGAFNQSAFKGSCVRATNLSASKRSSGYASFFSGLLITLGDPGAILFYMGLFPAFVNLQTISIHQTLLIMGMAALIIGGVKTTEAYLADRAKKVLEDVRVQRTLNMMSGCVLLGTGLVLLVK
ncbi:translocator protein, LysE family [Synechococcus sp. PCC 7335]|uniref:LysE family translocator n=1 Tax=Synechococcus sp. (strain ATCC 29403 / PCC 7335) TaxID=91464 RepID=UPI00017EC7A7|nr:LysE family translocator [Synechococcus sp. PCC 7335]EDX85654.1 translocator protein, LysE family [Synechococcus sp. PCC 7335]